MSLYSGSKSKLSDDELQQLWVEFEQYNPRGFKELMAGSPAPGGEEDGESNYSMIQIFLKLHALPEIDIWEENKIAFDMWALLTSLRAEQFVTN